VWREKKGKVERTRENARPGKGRSDTILRVSRKIGTLKKERRIRVKGEDLCTKWLLLKGEEELRG